MITAYVDFMDLDVHCTRKANNLNHSLTLFIKLTHLVFLIYNFHQIDFLAGNKWSNLCKNQNRDKWLQVARQAANC